LNKETILTFFFSLSLQTTPYSRKFSRTAFVLRIREPVMRMMAVYRNEIRYNLWINSV